VAVSKAPVDRSTLHCCNSYCHKEAAKQADLQVVAKPEDLLQVHQCLRQVNLLSADRKAKDL
jgi:hypothetical protein